MTVAATDPELYKLAEEYDQKNGLAGLNVEQAAQNLAAVGQPPPAVPLPVAPALGENDGQGNLPGGPTPAAVGAPEPVAPPAAELTDELATPALAAEVGPLEAAPPKPPAITGNPEQDARANIEWQRAVADHYGKRETELLSRSQSANAEKAAREAEVAKQEAEARGAAAKRDRDARAAAQVEVKRAVDERAAAHKDIEGANWADKHTGVAIAMTVFGAIGQGMQNASAALLGQVGHAENEGVKAIDQLMKRDYDIKKARLDAASDSLIDARHGLADTVTNRLAAQNDLDAEFAAKYRTVAKDAEALLRRRGADDETIKRNGIVANAAAQSAKFEGQIIEREAQRQLTREGHEATNNLANAHLNLSERAAAATEALGRGNLGERRREFNDTIAERKREADMRAEERAAAAEAKRPGGVDMSKMVRNVDGTAAGLAQGGRAAPAITTQLRNFHDAKEKLKRLRATDWASPRDPRFHDAVLAVATTTTAGATDTNVAHEKGTLTNVLGLPDNDAIDRKIEEVETRENEIRNQLNPLPDNYTDAKTPGTAKATVPATARAAMDNATEDRLWKVLDDPGAPPARRKQATDALRASGRMP